MKTVVFLTDYVECNHKYAKHALVEFKDATADRLIGAGIVELFQPPVPNQRPEVDSEDD